MAKTGKGLPRSLENTDFSSVVPEATAETAGLVKKGAAVTNIGTQTVTGEDATTVASVDSGTYKVVVHDVYGNIISSSTVATVS